MINTHKELVKIEKIPSNQRSHFKHVELLSLAISTLQRAIQSVFLKKQPTIELKLLDTPDITLLENIDDMRKKITLGNSRQDKDKQIELEDKDKKNTKLFISNIIDLKM